MEFVQSMEAAARHIRDVGVAKMIADHLEKHYPKYGWAVHADEDQGVVKVNSVRLSGKYGFMVKHTDFQEDPSLKIITRLGGEVLERFRVSIGRANDDQLTGLKQVAGEHIFDYHQMKNGKPSDAVVMRWDWLKAGAN